MAAADDAAARGAPLPPPSSPPPSSLPPLWAWSRGAPRAGPPREDVSYLRAHEKRQLRAAKLLEKRSQRAGAGGLDLASVGAAFAALHGGEHASSRDAPAPLIVGPLGQHATTQVKHLARLLGVAVADESGPRASRTLTCMPGARAPDAQQRERADALVAQWHAALAGEASTALLAAGTRRRMGGHGRGGGRAAGRDGAGRPSPGGSGGGVSRDNGEARVRPPPREAKARPPVPVPAPDGATAHALLVRRDASRSAAVPASGAAGGADTERGGGAGSGAGGTSPSRGRDAAGGAAAASTSTSSCSSNVDDDDCDDSDSEGSDSGSGDGDPDDDAALQRLADMRLGGGGLGSGLDVGRWWADAARGGASLRDVDGVAPGGRDVAAEARNPHGGGTAVGSTSAAPSAGRHGGSPPPPPLPPVAPALRADWESHTRGFGSAALARMGYRGGALGPARATSTAAAAAAEAAVRGGAGDASSRASPAAMVEGSAGVDSGRAMAGVAEPAGANGPGGTALPPPLEPEPWFGRLGLGAS